MIKQAVMNLMHSMKPIAIWKIPSQITHSRNRSAKLISDFEELDSEARNSIERNGFAKVLVLVKEDYDATHPNG